MASALLMTKHRPSRWRTGEGKSPISRSSASRRCRCCGGGYNTAASLYAIVCDADCHYFTISASRPPRIAFAVRPSGNIWTYWNTSIVSIYVPFYALLSPLSITLSPSLPTSRFVCLFFNARITGWAALRSMESFPQFGRTAPSGGDG